MTYLRSNTLLTTTPADKVPSTIMACKTDTITYNGGYDSLPPSFEAGLIQSSTIDTNLLFSKLAREHMRNLLQHTSFILKGDIVCLTDWNIVYHSNKLLVCQQH